MTPNDLDKNYILIVDYDEQWIESYEREAETLKNLLSDLLIQPHHIGSTSVKGLAAKPIVDILLEVSEVSAIDALKTTIIENGYQFWGEYGLAGRRFLTKGTAPRTHNIHCYESNDPEGDRHLAYRDYLRAHSDIAAKYESLKRQIAANCNHDIEKYCAGKDPFIKHHQKLALDYVGALALRSVTE